MKIAINREIGGFRLSHKAIMRLAELKNIKVYPYGEIIRIYPECLNKYEFFPIKYINSNYHFIEYFLEPLENLAINKEEYDNLPLWFDWADMGRNDPLLIQIIEELGKESAEKKGSIKIVEIPDDIKWYIHQSDEGYETVHEEHRVWY